MPTPREGYAAEPAPRHTAPGGGEPPKAGDWVLTLTNPAPDDLLLPLERQLLAELFRRGDVASINELKRHGFDITMREAQVGLYREVVDRGWYRKHPRERNRRLARLGILLLLVGIGAVVGGLYVIGRSIGTDQQWGVPLLTGGVGSVLGAALLIWGGRGRTPRTAEGSAARVQAMAFEKYLATAEAGQIRFEEARDVFSRFLPYAIVFGVAEHWAKVFGDVARQARMSGMADAAVDATLDLTWFDGMDFLSHAAAVPIDLGDPGPAMLDADGPGGLGDAFAFDGGDFLDTVGSGLAEVTSSVGDFVSSAGDLFDGGDGCLDGLDGCDGCDLP
ncbi:MAG: DUF2207 domain-containing protein [Micrococcales bacterium]|nr:DUF2207 domain-containing protein [Micrococcales bacterium]